MSKSPVVLIYTGNEADNELLREAIADAYPSLRLLAPRDTGEFAQALPMAEVLIGWELPAELLERAENLRWLQSLGTGVDGMLNNARVPEHVLITNIKGAFSSSMTEYALAYMLAHARRLRQTMANQAARRWMPFHPPLLRGQTVGIAGLGSIGREVARACAALGMRVIGLRRRPGSVDHVERVYVTSDIDIFLPECDFLVLVLPHTPATDGLLSRGRLQLLKPSCFMVNMGRGTVAREDDLEWALRTGVLAGAALDVFPEEPLPVESPLWSLENVFITPHIAGPNRIAELIAPVLENLDRYLHGRPLLNAVDRSRGY